MATTLYVWNNSPGDPGHASLQVNDTYISFWPESAAKAKKDIKIGQTHDPAFPSSYRVDCRLEGRKADHQLDISGLNEAQMAGHWSDFKEGANQYNMLKSNCSTVVAVILEIGSGVQPHISPNIRINDYVDNTAMRWFLKLRFLGNYIDMWTPNDVMTYALQINSNKNA